MALLGSSIFIFLVTSRENVSSAVTGAAVDHQVRIDYRKEVMPYLIAGGGVQVFQRESGVLATFFFVDIALAGVLTCLTLASQGFMLLQSGVTVVFSKLQSNNESANRTILSKEFTINWQRLVPHWLFLLFTFLAPVFLAFLMRHSLNTVMDYSFCALAGFCIS